MSSSSKKSERQNDHFWARVCNLLLVDIHGSLLGTATYANDCIISILNLDMPSCMHCQSIVCQNSIARILYAKIPLLEFHMPIVLYAEIPIAEIQESLNNDWLRKTCSIMSFDTLVNTFLKLSNEQVYEKQF